MSKLSKYLQNSVFNDFLLNALSSRVLLINSITKKITPFKINQLRQRIFTTPTTLRLCLRHFSAKMGKRKAPEGQNNPNSDFCDFLTELANYEKNVSRNIHKYNAYRKAATVLASHPVRIKSGTEAKKLEGIGAKISAKIDEFLKTGKLQKLDDIHQNTEASTIDLLTRISGIGPAKAQSLVKEGIRTLEELEKHPEKLTHHQQIGLKYFHDFEKKVPREEIQKIESRIKNTLEKEDAGIIVTICGSYRRGKKESGDIDALITKKDLLSTSDKKHKTSFLKSIVEELKTSGLITETLGLGESKFMGACKLDNESPTRRLDIRFTPYDQYYCAVLYFTGSDMFNRSMRSKALEMGFTLNEYTLRPVGTTGITGEPVEIHSEKEIFECIDFPYKEPHERD